MPGLGELAFQFLGVNTEGCRRRFICEFDFRTRNNPIMKFTYGLIRWVTIKAANVSFINNNFIIYYFQSSRSLFDRYRDLSDGNIQPQLFSDCARIFNDCKAAEKYNNIEQDYTNFAETENDEDNYEEIEGSANSSLEKEATSATEKQLFENQNQKSTKTSDNLVHSLKNEQAMSTTTVTSKRQAKSMDLKEFVLSRQRRFK